MKNAIEELIINNSELIESIKPSNVYLSLLEEANKLYLKLKEVLSAEHFDLVDKIIDKHLAMESDAVDRFMGIGFKAGIRICAECFIDN